MPALTTYLFKRLFIAAVAGVAAFFLFRFIFQQALVTQCSFDLVISIEADQAFKMTGCYNALPDEKKVEMHTVKVHGAGTHEIRFPYPDENSLDRIFFYTRPRKVTMRISSISLDGAFIDWKADDLSAGIGIAGANDRNDEQITVLEDGRIELSLQKKFPVGVINRTVTTSMNAALQKWPFIFALISGSLVFIVVLLLVGKTSRIVHYSGYELALPMLFLLILFIPFISEKNFETRENRALAPFPDLNQLVWNIPGDYTEYYNDHFPFRNTLGQFNNQMKVQLFNVSPMPDHVRIGKKGWLFDNFNNIREMYMGDSLFSAAQLKRIGEILMEKRDWLALKGSDFYYLMPPLKHEVYPEYLPASMKPKKKVNKRTQVIDYLKHNTDIKMIDPFEILMAHKDSIQIYYKTDTHWNKLGAFFVYHRLMELIRKDHPELNIFELTDYTISRQKYYNGDLLALMNIDTFFYREPYVLTPKHDIHAVEYRDAERHPKERKEYKYFRNEHTSGLRLLVFRDSFCSYFIEHLREHFSYSAFSWSTAILPERVDEVNPDIVIFESMQMFMNDMLIDNEELIKREVREAREKAIR